MAPRVMLLCGEDLLQSFCKPGVWREQDIPTIFTNHGVVCVARPNSAGSSLVLDKVLSWPMQGLIAAPLVLLMQCM